MQACFTNNAHNVQEYAAVPSGPLFPEYAAVPSGPLFPDRGSNNSPMPTASSVAASHPLLVPQSSARQVLVTPEVMANQARALTMVPYQAHSRVVVSNHGNIAQAPQHVRQTSGACPAELRSAPAPSAAKKKDAPPSNKGFVHPAHRVVPPHKWCVSKQDLEEFEQLVLEKHGEGLFDDDRNKTGLYNLDIGPSVYIVNEKLIKPVTQQEGGMSWALMKNRDGLHCDLFATHCWQEGILEFILKVQKAWPVRARGLWACFLAIPQNCDIPEVIGTNPHKSPFAKAVKVAQHIVVVPNHKTSIYERLWCVFEAYVAMNELERRNELSISIPLMVSPCSLMAKTFPGLLFPAIGVVLGVFYLGPFIGFLLGPVMWLLSTFLLCTVIARVANGAISRRVKDHRQSCQLMIIVCYFELFLVGIGSGLAWWHLFGVECKSHMKLFEGLCMPSNQKETVSNMIFGVTHLGFRFEHGEEVSCMLVLVTLVLVYMWHIFLLLIRKCLELEGSLLNFETVKNATCSDKRDHAMIMDSIEHELNHIDRMIKMLKSIGRYNSAVKKNLELGLPWESARHGIDYFKLACSITMWEFWWITDLCGRHRFTAGILLPVISILVAELIVCYVGEIAVHAINTSLVFGIVFVMVGNHHVFFTHLAVQSLSMSVSTLWLQLVFFFLFLAVNIWFYTGGRQVTTGGDILENVLTCANCEELTSDEEAYRRTLTRFTDSEEEEEEEEDDDGM